jgi:glycosyl hydrolase family 2
MKAALKICLSLSCTVIGTHYLYGEGRSTVFDRDFAPTEGMVKPQEEPFRAERCLNGKWDFQLVEIPSSWTPDQGIPPPLRLPDATQWEDVKIKIPSPWNVNSLLHDRKGQGMDSRTYPSYPETWNTARMGWLRKKVKIPTAWQDKDIYLHLEAVAGDCRILVNNQEIGLHFDPSLPGEFDVTSAVAWGRENEILLGIRDAKLYSRKGKYGAFTYPTGSFWLTDAIGVWQDVFLLAKPKVRVADVFIQPQVSQDRLLMDVELVNHSRERQTLQIEALIYPWINHSDLSRKNILKAPEISWSLGPKVLALPSSPLALNPGQQQTVTLQETVKGRLEKWEVWTRGKPTLYAAVVQVRHNDQITDKKFERFGWREVKLHEGDFFLNGKRLHLMHEGWHFTGIPSLTRRYAWGWYTLAQEAHVNFIRPHAMPHPRFFYDLADEMGMLLIDESAIFASHCNFNYESEEFWQRSRKHIKNLVLRDRNHPSLVGWSVANEVRCVLVWQAADNPNFQQTVYDNIFGLCQMAQALDPTRQWIQSDGDKDLDGRLDVYTIHCGSRYEDPIPKNKLWGVTEGGSSYFGKPGYYETYVGDRAYRSFHDRMDALAIECYHLTRKQRNDDADICVGWNLAWHGIKPLPVGLKDVSRKQLALTDGVFFAPYMEGKPGIQPERIAPFSVTVNPGWDMSLPLFEPYPLYTALKAGMHPQGPLPCKWDHIDESSHQPKAPEIEPKVNHASFIGNTDGVVYDSLRAIGVPFSTDAEREEFLFIDVSSLPINELDQVKSRAKRITKDGGLVLLIGLSEKTQDIANRILPARIACMSNEASSLVPNTKDPRTASISYKELYFAENFTNRMISQFSLHGDLVTNGKTLLYRNNTDWRRWLENPEYSKTISVYRSELENARAPVFVEYATGSESFMATTLVFENLSEAHVDLYRKLLANLGLALQPKARLAVSAFTNDVLVRSLALGRFGASSVKEAMDTHFIAEGSIKPVENDVSAGKRWQVEANAGDRFVLHQLNQTGPEKVYVSYFSYWIYSPISLDDLLGAGPDLPQVSKHCYVSDACKVFLNGKVLDPAVAEPADYRVRQTYRRIPLKQGWNHFLIKVASDSFHQTDPGTLAVRLLSNSSAFDRQLKSAVQISQE